MKNKENFYIFLDIDGVLWDWNWRKNEFKNGNSKQMLANKFNPESIAAINFLIENLSKNYNCLLVISSTWRYNMEQTKNALIENGLKYDNKIYSTPILPNPYNRSEEILQFLNNKETENLLIIDDENFDFFDNFPSENIIKTNITNHSINKIDIINWSKNFNGVLNRQYLKFNYNFSDKSF